MTSDLEISTDPARLDLEVIHGFLTTTYWAKGRSRATVERSLAHSLCFGAYLGGQQVGFARVVSDRTIFAYVMDVFVLPDFRGRGFSRTLIRTVLDHPELQSIRLFLLGTRDAHGLYEKLGFRALPDPNVWMLIRRAPNESHAAEPGGGC